MKTIEILMGIAGAGKSTFAKKLNEKLKGIILSSDEIRKEFVSQGVIPKEYDSKYNPIVFGELHKRVREYAEKGESMIIDSTNVLESSRSPIIEIAKEFKYKISGRLLLLDDEECVRRILQRQEHDKTAHYISDPKLAVEIYKKRLLDGWPKLSEGFHEIITYDNGKIKDRECRVLIASTNAGKVAIYANILEKLGLDYCSLRDLKVDIEVEETGNTEIENAMLKAEAYHEVIGLPVISNDSGLVIEKFKPEDQPGVFVRRYGDRELTDEEMIDIFSKRLEAVGGESDSYFNVALVLCDKDGIYHQKLFKSERYMVAKPSKVITKGLPLRSLDYNRQLGKYMSELTIEEANASEGKCLEEQAEFIKSVFDC